MKIALLLLFGFIFGAMAGGLIGVGCGLIWTGVFAMNRQGVHSESVLLLVFLPAGLIAGGVIGAVALGYFGGRDSSEVR